MERWERDRFERLEERIDRIERRSQERADARFRLTIHAFTAAFVLLAIAAIAIGVSQPGS